MGKIIDADKLLENQYRIDDSATLSTRDVVNVEDIEDAPPVEAIPKAEYKVRLKADLESNFAELQLEIKELWDSRHDVWLDDQYYIGKNDTLEEVDKVIQQKIDKLKEDRK